MPGSSREAFRSLIARREVRLSLDPAGQFDVPRPGRVYLHLGSLFVGMVSRQGLDAVAATDGAVLVYGGLWSASLQPCRIPRSAKEVPLCHPYAVGRTHLTMWDALTALLLEFDWRHGATARPARIAKGI